MTAADVLLVLAMAGAVYVPKALPLVVASEDLTLRLRPWLQYVAPAVLGALVAPSILGPSPPPALAWSHAAFAVAFVVALLTRKMIPALATGLAALVLVTLVHP
jgi:branched-subunit amino acid transport protein